MLAKVVMPCSLIFADAICRGISLGGYIFCLVVGCIAIPHIYPPVKWCDSQCTPRMLMSPAKPPTTSARCSVHYVCTCVACPVHQLLCLKHRANLALHSSLSSTAFGADLLPATGRYYLIVAFLFVPFFAMANAYAAGLTDQDNYR